MEIFLKEKQIFGLVLLLCLTLPNFLPINVSIQLLLNSVACVALGSYFAIKISKNQRHEVSDDDEEESVSMEDALKFPIFATIALVSLYILFKNVDKDFLNFVFKVNFSIMGANLIGSILKDNIRMIFPTLPEQDIVYYHKKLDFKYIQQTINITQHSIYSYGIGIIIGLFYFYFKSWVFNNILGIIFSITGIMFLKVADIKTLYVLLWCLFVYDIIMVFKSDLMITVAKNLDAPIRLILPNGDKKSILGLGDIVIPGILVAFCLKFDIDMALELMNKEKSKEMKSSFTYYWTALIGYTLGMISTFVGMFLMEHAQPALLYLVPWTTILVFLQALYQGEVKKLYQYRAYIEKEKKN